MAKLTPSIELTDHVLGNRDAPVILTEYGDYECPYCARAHLSVKQVLEHIGDSVAFVYRNFPLAQVHPHAVSAAEAAEAAGAQGNFWPMHDMVFENQDRLERDDLIAYAAALDLDTTRFASELESHTHLDKIKADFRSGVRSGVNGTPTFFIDDERYDLSWDPDTLEAALRRAISAKRKRPAAAAPQRELRR